MEYTASAEVKQAISRAHMERAQVMRSLWTWLVTPRRMLKGQIGISRWA